MSLQHIYSLSRIMLYDTNILTMTSLSLDIIAEDKTEGPLDAIYHTGGLKGNEGYWDFCPFAESCFDAQVLTANWCLKCQFHDESIGAIWPVRTGTSSTWEALCPSQQSTD